MSIREGLRHYSNFGIRGVLAISGYRLLRWPKEVTVRPPGIRSRVSLRLKTTDEWVYKQVLLRYEYAADLRFTPKVILDAGANIGMTSIFFAHRYPEAQIIAVEPEPANYSVLIHNVRPYPRIIPVNAALWNRDGKINIAQPDPGSVGGGECGFITREGRGAEVRAITMCTLMRELGVARIDLAKIDIEGAEQELFEDCGWLAGVRCVMLELHDQLRPGCTAAVEPAMRAFSRAYRGETTFYFRKSFDKPGTTNLKAN